MSKVYEALINAHAERHLIVHAKEPVSAEVQVLEIPIARELPPLQMGKEMSRLYHGMSSLQPEGIIQFIASRKNEGTSTIVREFALYVATMTNNSVLIVDADRIHMPQHRVFGVRPRLSLESIMNEGGSVDSAISQVNDSRLFLCPLFDRNIPDPRHADMSDTGIWNKLRKEFSLILIDSPPIDEALPFSGLTDGVVLIIEAERTRSRVVSHLKTRIVQNGGRILGLVFNKQRYYIPEWIYKRL
jgi:Mrp family chromosome partitioning ATPase